MGRIVFVIFFFSGGSSLILETLWIRLLTLVFGSTTFAISTVVAAFMGGLALGSYLIGRFADEIRRPFLLYGLCEGAIGLYALLLPVILDRIPALLAPLWSAEGQSFYVLSLIRFGVVFLLLLIPTTLMGGTLPLLSTCRVIQRREIGATVGTLYAVNTFGAIAGTAICGFLLLPVIGVSTTNLLAAGIDLALCALVVALRRLETDLPRGVEGAQGVAPTVEGVGRPPSYPYVAAAFALSGFAALIYQIVWSRSLTLVIGSSIYAYTILLTTFLVGLALGSAIYVRRHLSDPDPIGNLAMIQLLIGLFGFAGLRFIDRLPALFLLLLQFFSLSVPVAFLLKFFLCALVIFLPTFFMGMTFPASVKAVIPEGSGVGREVGKLYALNTIGAIAGSFAGGFLCIPFLGLERSILLAAILNVLFALLLLVGRMRATRLPPRKGLAIATLLALVSFPLLHRPWDKVAMTSGVFRLGVYEALERRGGAFAEREAAADEAPFDRAWLEGEIGEAGRRLLPREVVYTGWEPHIRLETLYHREGITTTVTTRRLLLGSPHPEIEWQTLSLRVNGKVDASVITRISDRVPIPEGERLAYRGDEEIQILLGALPILVSPRAPKDAMVLGYGSGMTLGSLLQSPIEGVVMLEIEPAIVEGAAPFLPFNHRAPEDERVSFVFNDGRNYLLTTRRTFDVLVSAPSNPWIAGIGNLFSVEFFEMVRDRMKPGGVFVQWLQAYEISPANVRTVVRTFHEVFPYVAVFHAKYTRSDVVLVGAMEPLNLSRSGIETRMEDPRVGQNLASLGVHTPYDVLARLVLTEGEIPRFTGEKVPLNTDDNVHLEFSTPKDLIRYRRPAGEDIGKAMIERFLPDFPRLAPRLFPMAELPRYLRALLAVGEWPAVARLVRQFPAAGDADIEGLLARFAISPGDKAAILAAAHFEAWPQRTDSLPAGERQAFLAFLDLCREATRHRGRLPNRMKDRGISLAKGVDSAALRFMMLGVLTFLDNDPYAGTTFLSVAIRDRGIGSLFPELRLLRGMLYRRCGRFDLALEDFASLPSP